MVYNDRQKHRNTHTHQMESTNIVTTKAKHSMEMHVVYESIYLFLIPDLKDCKSHYNVCFVKC